MIRHSSDGGPGVISMLGDGTLESVELVTVFDPPPQLSATDLDFTSERPAELWVVLRQPRDETPCNQPPAGAAPDPACDSYEGSVAIITDATGDAPKGVVKRDPNAWHFMRLPSSIAFGTGGMFSTCGEARTGNWDDEPADFMGPTLWSSDSSVFAIQDPGQNGSHIDMLHASPFGMGVAHERDNIYWVFNGQVGALDRYDFHQPHEPGGENHSDGQAWRWALGEVKRIPGIPSHLVVDTKNDLLYVADTGNGRILRVDLNTGTEGNPLPTDDAQLPFITRIDGATIDDLVPSGLLEKPSGIALHGESLLVTDNATSRIQVFDLSGKSGTSLDTGLPSGSLAGLTIGPDGKVYFADLKTGQVRRVDPKPTAPASPPGSP